MGLRPGLSPVLVDNKFTPGKWMAFDPIPTRVVKAGFLKAVREAVA